MTQITLNIPDNELDFFLELAKKFNYTIAEIDFELSPEQLEILDQSSSISEEDCLSKEQFRNNIKYKYGI